MLALRAALVLCLAMVTAHGALAQDYPIKTVRVLAGFSAGGGVDLVTRTVTPHLAEAFKQQFVVDNRPGANGMIAAELAARAAPDGYTLLAAPGNYAFAPALVSKLPFDMATAFSAVGQMVDSPLLVVVHPSLPAKDLKAMVALARARPGQLSYGSGGTGGAAHLATELFKSVARVDLLHIPYKGTAPALTDLISGQVSVCFCTLPPTLPHARSGRLRALAVTTARRSVAAPDVPTVAEAGVGGYVMSQWYGLLAPAGTPPAILERLSTELRRALVRPELRQRLLTEGAEPVESSPQAFGAFFRAEIERWTQVVKSAGLRTE